MVADGKELVERDDDLAVRQGPPNVEQRLDAEIGIVVQMHHVWPQLMQQRGQCGGEFRIRVGLDPVIVASAGIDKLIRPEGLLDAGAEPLLKASTTGSQEVRLRPRLRLHHLVHLVGSNLGPAPRCFRMHVRHEQHPQRRGTLRSLRGSEWGAIGRTEGIGNRVRHDEVPPAKIANILQPRYYDPKEKYRQG